MKLIKNKNKLKYEIYNLNTIAFVPTMGNLHNGHIDLIKKAKKKAKNIVVSIFVNPRQFGSSKDFKSYPRSIKKDLKILKKLKVKFVFKPSVNDIYNFKTKNKPYIHRFERKLCGKFRPGHFLGVLNVVNRFLEIINPKYLFLGNKDFQQSFLIKENIKKNKLNVQVINCSTVRNKNGLALSSRNNQLNKNQIKKAEKIIKFLRKNKPVYRNSGFKKSYLDNLKKKIKKIGISKIDYLTALNLKTLKTPNKLNKSFNFFVAFYINNIRLIDNF